MALKIIFMGTPDFAIPALEAINQSNHQILEVYTQPPKKKTEVKRLAFPQSMFTVIKKISQLERLKI